MRPPRQFPLIGQLQSLFPDDRAGFLRDALRSVNQAAWQMSPKKEDFETGPPDEWEAVRPTDRDVFLIAKRWASQDLDMTVIVNHGLYNLCCCYRHDACKSLMTLVGNYNAAKAATHDHHL